MLTNRSIEKWLQDKAPDQVRGVHEHRGELTVEVDPAAILKLCYLLRDDHNTKFEQLIDLCGVDYSQYGYGEGGLPIRTFSGQQQAGEWISSPSAETGKPWKGPRYAVVYHLLSITHNARLRLKTFLEDESPRIISVVEVWNGANWFEREAFDLFGIIFEGHPDLRRLLTDYGFIGHPFRKDFPLVGHVEMRYDPQKGRVVYEPVKTKPRTLVPRVIRSENPQ